MNLFGKKLKSATLKTLGWFPAACVLIPLLLVAWRATGDGGAAWGRIVQYQLWGALGNTALLIFLVVTLTVVIGVASAWMVTAYDFKGRRALEWLLILPLGVPAFVAGAAYLDGFEKLTPLFLWIRENQGLEAFLFSQKLLPWVGAVLVLVVTLYPYVYMSCRATFARQQADQIEAARLLGSSQRRVFFRVVLPLARPAIAAGAALVAMETANDYGVVSLFGIKTLTPGVFRAWSEGSLVSAMRLAFILLTLVLFVMSIERAQRGRRGYAGNSRERPLARTPLSPGQSIDAWLICGIPLLLGFAWPVLRFATWAISSGDFANGQEYFQAFFNTTWLSLVASGLVVISALWLTAGSQAWRLKGSRPMQQMASLGYAIPSALLAVGIGVLVSELARVQGLAWLALSASACGLVFAYWVRFMAVGIQPVASAQTGVTADYHDAARMLGASPLRALMRVDIKILRPALAAAAILCFVDIFKELTLTLVMRPFDFETLATLTFRLSSEGRIPEASLPALVLVAGGMLGVVAMNKLLRART